MSNEGFKLGWDSRVNRDVHIDLISKNQEQIYFPLAPGGIKSVILD